VCIPSCLRALTNAYRTWRREQDLGLRLYATCVAGLSPQHGGRLYATRCALPLVSLSTALFARYPHSPPTRSASRRICATAHGDIPHFFACAQHIVNAHNICVGFLNTIPPSRHYYRRTACGHLVDGRLLRAMEHRIAPHAFAWRRVYLPPPAALATLLLRSALHLKTLFPSQHAPRTQTRLPTKRGRGHVTGTRTAATLVYRVLLSTAA